MECSECTSPEELCPFHAAVKAAIASLWAETNQFAEFEVELDWGKGNAHVETTYFDPDPMTPVDAWEVDKLVKRRLREHTKDIGEIDIKQTANGLEVTLL